MNQTARALTLMTLLLASTARAGNSGGTLPPYTGPSDMNQAGQQSAQQVQGAYGTTGSMNNGLAQPLNSSTSMTTVDGSQSFGAQVGCPSSKQYLQVTMFPQSSGDLAQVALDWDPSFSGSYTSHFLMTGPFSGVCNNGLIACDAGTFNNCHYYQWQASSSAISLMAVAQEWLGACYCINNYCGSGLALSNSKKVLSDMGGGITHALNNVYPRLVIAQSQYPDPTQEVFYGNQNGCTTPTTPETYFNSTSTASLPSAGAAAASDPSSGYYMVLHSPAAQSSQVNQISCSVTREYDVTNVDKNKVIQVLSRSGGSTIDCGSGCLDLRLGTGSWGQHEWCPGACTLETDSEQIQVTGGQFVTSAEFTQYTYDDWGQEWVNNKLVWTVDPTWTSQTQPIAPGGSCDTGTDHGNTPNVDVSSFFQSNGVVPVSNNVSVGGCGNAWSDITIHVNEGCQIQDTYINDQCAAAESNTSCQLRDETVDGVPTVQNYMSTGLAPVPSTQTISGPTCTYGPVTNPWWQKQRTYVCKTGPAPTYDFSDAVKRNDEIVNTLDPSSGNFTDRTVQTQDGPATFSASNVTLPPATKEPACFQTCETAKAALGPPVGDQSGPTNNMNGSGTPQSYTFKECSDSGVCPLDPGETIVSACACTNDFGKAASMMQLIRMTQQDAICTTGP